MADHRAGADPRTRFNPCTRQDYGVVANNHIIFDQNPGWRWPVVTVSAQGVKVVVYDLYERPKYTSTANLYALDRFNRSATIDAHFISKLQKSVTSAVKLDRRYTSVKSDIVSYPDCSPAMYPN